MTSLALNNWAQLAKWVVLPTSWVRIPLEVKLLSSPQHFVVQSLSLSPFHHLDMTNNIERDVKYQIIIISFGGNLQEQSMPVFLGK